MKGLKVKNIITTEMTLNDHNIEDVIYAAKELAHEVLEELSVYRQRNELDISTFDCEGSACKFLDMIGD
jgi:hypothetical protein